MQPGPGGQQRPHLDHVDAMRPLKQAGVVGTHCLLFFGPPASAGVGAALLLSHVTRFAFMFISAAMLVYAYPRLGGGQLRRFWRRRLLAVALPYVTWTVVYFVFESLPIAGTPAAFRPTGGATGSLGATFDHLGYLLLTGYYQLYYLVLLLELYVLYPLLLGVLRRTHRHHGWVVGTSLALQLALSGLEHWALLPSWMLGWAATRELWNYQFFIVSGAVLAWHYRAAHDWLVGHWRSVLAATVVTLTAAEAWFALSLSVPALAGGDPSDPFQPVAIPAFGAIIAALYLLGVVLASDRRRPRTRSLVRRGAANSYGVYLSQVLFVSLLSAAGFARLDAFVPWPAVVASAVVVVYACAFALTDVLARLPGARATAGRPRVSSAAGIGRPAPAPDQAEQLRAA